MLNNKEIAFIIWTVITMAVWRSFRLTVWGLLRHSSKIWAKVLIVVALTSFYFFLIVNAMTLVGLWEWSSSSIKDLFLFVFVFLITIKEVSGETVKSQLFSAISVSSLVVFYTSLTPLPLYLELIATPIVLLAAIMFAKFKNENSFTVSVSLAVIFGYTALSLVYAYQHAVFDKPMLDYLAQLVSPAILGVSSIPLATAWIMFFELESARIRIDYHKRTIREQMDMDHPTLLPSVQRYLFCPTSESWGRHNLRATKIIMRDAKIYSFLIGDQANPEQLVFRANVTFDGRRVVVTRSKMKHGVVYSIRGDDEAIEQAKLLGLL